MGDHFKANMGTLEAGKGQDGNSDEVGGKQHVSYHSLFHYYHSTQKSQWSRKLQPTKYCTHVKQNPFCPEQYIFNRSEDKDHERGSGTDPVVQVAKQGRKRLCPLCKVRWKINGVQAQVTWIAVWNPLQGQPSPLWCLGQRC